MLRDYEKGDVVQYAGNSKFCDSKFLPKIAVGLIVDVEYRVKPDDFLIFIMWSDGDRPQALFQKDCYNRGLGVLS